MSPRTTQVTRVAKTAGVSLPPSGAAAAARLGDEAGARFDHDVTSTMTTGHEGLIGQTRTETARGSVPEIARLAGSTLPVLRRHLAALRKAAASG
jgi:Domain of unknown function (DUF4142)